MPGFDHYYVDTANNWKVDVTVDRRTDADLVVATRGGDKEAFGRLVERHLPMTKRGALRMVGDPEVAQELAQEAMLQAYLSLDNLREIDRFQSWLYGIMRNVCRNYLRSQKADFLSWEAVSGGVHVTSADLNPQVVVERRELYQRVQEAIESLSPKNQAATRLFYYEQLSTREIAARLGASVAAIKDRLYQSRKKLREQLTPIHAQMSDAPDSTDSFDERRVAMVKVTAVHALQHQETDHYILYLTDIEGQRVLPIWVGLYEGHQIAQLLSRDATARPMTFRFMASLLNALGATLQEVRVETLKDNVFYAVVKASNGEATQELDARPSDAIALALQTDTPLFVAEEVMEKAAQDLPQAADEQAGVEALHHQTDEGHRRAGEWKQRIQAETDVTERTQSVLAQMQTEALRLDHNYIGTEHLLLSLVRDRQSAAAKVLRPLGVKLGQVTGGVDRVVGRGRQTPSGEPILAPRVAQVLELAAEEQRRLGHAAIGTEHLFLGMLDEGQGAAISVLRDLNVDLDQVRAKALKLVTSSQD